MRDDLYALTPEAVAGLANMGLVKRALKELEQGKAPALEELADGTVVGKFEDGAAVKLVPGKPLKDVPCTCPAVGACRHRVAAALAYKAFADASAPRAAAAPGATPWDPGEATDEALLALLGKRTLDEARGARRRGVLAEIERGSVPAVKLPSCTVRFLVPRDLAYARCDCAVAQACAHVALAVWAFRAADPAKQAQRVDLSARGSAKDDADAPAIALILEVIIDGVVHAREALAQRFVLAREPLDGAGWVWLSDALEELESALERYRARSSRYRAATVLALCAELIARGRAARADGAELPADYVLGRGEARETKLDHLRLVSLGCHLDADGRERSAEVLLADPDSGTVLVLDKSWTFAEGESIPEGSDLARKRVAGSATLGQLARGQVVTRAARRRANRALVLGQSGLGATSVLPQNGDLSVLPAPLRASRASELTRALASRPPRLLRARIRAEDVHALEVKEIDGVAFDPAEQRLTAFLHDDEDGVVRVSASFRSVAPAGIDALGRALLGQHGPVRWIAGPVRHDGAGLVIEPTLVAADLVIVPDIAEVGPPAEVQRGRGIHGADVIGQRLGAADGLLEEAVQVGLRDLAPSFRSRARAAAAALTGVGLAGAASAIEHAASEIASAQASGLADSYRAAARAVLDAAIVLSLVREARASAPDA